MDNKAEYILFMVFIFIQLGQILLGCYDAFLFQNILECNNMFLLVKCWSMNHKMRLQREREVMKHK